MSVPNSTTSLPAGYRLAETIDLQKDKKAALKVNLLGLGAMLLMILAMLPFRRLHLPQTGEPGPFLLRAAVLCAAYLAYIALHELTHAAVMRHFGARKVRFGFTGLYAFAGSEEDYFAKLPYRAIALAPLLVWGVLFGLLCLLVPRDWFWTAWLLQVGNVSGAMGDVWVTLHLRHRPDACLIRDTGVNMQVWVPGEREEQA